MLWALTLDPSKVKTDRGRAGAGSPHASIQNSEKHPQAAMPRLKQPPASAPAPLHQPLAPSLPPTPHPQFTGPAAEDPPKPCHPPDVGGSVHATKGSAAKTEKETETDSRTWKAMMASSSISLLGMSRWLVGSAGPKTSGQQGGRGGAVSEGVRLLPLMPRILSKSI